MQIISVQEQSSKHEDERAVKRFFLAWKKRGVRGVRTMCVVIIGLLVGVCHCRSEASSCLRVSVCEIVSNRRWASCVVVVGHSEASSNLRVPVADVGDCELSLFQVRSRSSVWLKCNLLHSLFSQKEMDKVWSFEDPTWKHDTISLGHSVGVFVVM